jgi:hypothetical protein
MVTAFAVAISGFCPGACPQVYFVPAIPSPHATATG